MKLQRKLARITIAFLLMAALFSAGQVFAKSSFSTPGESSVDSPDQTCLPVSNTPNFTFAYGNITLDGVSAPVGAMVEAFSPRGDLVGCTILSINGKYGAMFIYGEDTSILPPIPGMRSGETVTFKVNGGTALAAPALVWSPDKDLHSVDLTATTPQKVSDLSILKTDSPDPVNAGSNLTYSLAVTNNGPSTATGVTVSDSLPSGLTLVSATPSQGSCSGSSPISCQIGSLNNQVGVGVTIIATVNASYRGSLSNTATVSGDQSDSNSANNSSTSTTTIAGSADLSITKGDTPDPVIAGNNLTYTIGVTNNGPSNATGVTVSDNLPSGTTLVSVNATSVSCSGTTIISCAPGNLNSGASITITIIVTVNADTRGSISNTATVSGSENDPNPANNSATATTTTNASTDLSILNVDNPDPVTAGNNLTYTVTVTNEGPSKATGVTMSDTLPSGVSFVSATPSQGSCSGTSAISCSIGVMNPHATATIALVVKVNPGQRASLSNTATVSGTETDPTPGNNSATATTNISSSADLSIIKTDAPDLVIAGNTLTYSISVTNNGPSQATGASVSDTLPAGVTYVSATPSQGTCSGTTAVSCLLGVLDPQASATIGLVVSIDPSKRGSISNAASVSATETDPEPANNTATATTTVSASADLSITKTDGSDPVIAGNNLTYTIGVTNNGPSTATGVSVSDAIPTGSTFVSATPGQGTCSGTNTTTCSLGTLNPQAQVTVTLVVKVAPATQGTLSNTASVSGNETDPIATNNSATASTSVTAAAASADLAILKTDSPDPVVAGNNLTYTIGVTNNGPSNATGVTVSDTLPSGTTYVSANSTAGSCSGITTISCTPGTLNSGASITITIIVTVNADTRGSISNITTVTGTESDSNPVNNSATATTTVNTSADLAILKVDSPDPVTAGNDLTYTLTITNNGPSKATGVTVSDTLPSGVSFVSATPSQGSCSGRSAISCSIGAMNSHATATVSLVVKVNPDQRTSLSNSASVSGTETDPAPGNNSATVNTTVNASADLSLSKLGSPDPVWVSQVLTYTLTATNNGPSSATGVMVTDNLPGEVFFVSANPSQGNCSGSPAISCNIGTLAPQAIATIVIKVVVKLSAPDTLINTVGVTGSESDPDLQNNTASVTTTVKRYKAYLPVTRK